MLLVHPKHLEDLLALFLLRFVFLTEPMFSIFAHVLGDCSPLYETFMVTYGNANYSMCLESIIVHDL